MVTLVSESHPGPPLPQTDTAGHPNLNPGTHASAGHSNNGLAGASSNSNTHASHGASVQGGSNLTPLYPNPGAHVDGHGPVHMGHPGGATVGGSKSTLVSKGRQLVKKIGNFFSRT